MFSFFKKKVAVKQRGCLENFASKVMASDEDQFRSIDPAIHAVVLAWYAGFQAVDGQKKIKGFEGLYVSANREILACQYSAYLINGALASIAPRFILGEYGEEPEIADLAEDAWQVFPILVKKLREECSEDEGSYLDGFETWCSRVRQEYYNRGVTNRNEHPFDPPASLAANITSAISAKSFEDVAEPTKFQLVSEQGLINDIYGIAQAANFGTYIIPAYLDSLRQISEITSS